MKVLDFAGSFVTFVTKDRSNAARLQVESRCEIEGEEFFLFAACRAENMYLERELFKIPSYEFCGVFSKSDHLIIRTHARAGDNNPWAGANQERFAEVRIDVALAAAEVLETNEAIVEATLANRSLVGRTELEEAGRRVVLEYPIKTMNVEGEGEGFQVDTGPLAFLDWSGEAGSLVERFRLAHLVYNRLDKAEFILQVPTALFEGGVQVSTINHYSEVREVPGRNTLLAVKG